MLLKVRNPRTLFRLAAGALAVFGLLGMPRVSSSFGEGVIDGARGAMLGATIGLLFLMFRMQRKVGKSGGA